MAVVAVAITLSFHLKTQPSAVELRMALPLGLIFWILAVLCLAMGLGNYISTPKSSEPPLPSISELSLLLIPWMVETVNKYSRKAALVQTGWRTQSIISLIAITIVGTCIVLLVIAKVKVDFECDAASLLPDKRCVQDAVDYYIRRRNA
ncbi:hypothetical protein SLS62_000076 [Diatrype stigma]|uniref:Uncharacterized protein n=1 Tax=Diatrype stigma TaxID=117547 RepID=A0AAN9YSS5_9PEZI